MLYIFVVFLIIQLNTKFFQQIIKKILNNVILDFLVILIFIIFLKTKFYN